MLSCKTKEVALLPGLLVFCLVLALPNNAFAQFSSPGGGVDDSNGVFQLEGNATKDTAICFNPTGGPDGGAVLATPSGTSCPGGFTYVQFGSQTEDWDTIFAANNNNGATLAVASSFVSDPINGNGDTIYTGGSTKDNLDITGWLWKTGKPQAKDDIEHAFAAAYNRADGHTILVVGADRYDNSGASTMGFWLVQDSTVGSGVTTCNSGSGCPFGGKHTDGDLLIVSDFSQGGPVTNIAVYKWSAGSLVAVNTIPGALIGQCNPITGNKDLCGIVPDQNVSAPWAFQLKGQAGPVSSSTFAKGELLEVGLDLSTIFQNTPCFTTFFAETRSSNQPGSTLSDFTTPKSFPLCSISATKQCTGAAITGGGTSVTYSFNGQITAKGGTFTNVSIADKPNSCANYLTSSQSGTFCTSGTENFSDLVLNQPAQSTVSPGSPATYSGSFTTNFISSTFDNRVQASATTPDNTTITGPAGGASWLVNGSNGCAPTVNGCLALTKSCNTVVTSGNPLALRVSFTGSITNNANVQVGNITISDSPAAAAAISITCGTGCTGTANGSFTLAPGGTATYSGFYTESGSGIICTPDDSGRCKFTDTVTASGTGALGTGTISSCTPPTTASCSLCPNGTCSTGN
jgi:hypothetical protein